VLHEQQLVERVNKDETATEASTCVFHRGQNQLDAVACLSTTSAAAHERTVGDRERWEF
jgi:hypothetical protein